MAEQRINYAVNGDASIAHSVFGEGEIDLVCVGGFVGHLEISSEQPQAKAFFDRLASFARLIVFDKRGMGLSDRDLPYTIEGIHTGECEQMGDDLGAWPSTSEPA